MGTGIAPVRGATLDGDIRDQAGDGIPATGRPISARFGTPGTGIAKGPARPFRERSRIGRPVIGSRSIACDAADLVARVRERLRSVNSGQVHFHALHASLEISTGAAAAIGSGKPYPYTRDHEILTGRLRSKQAEQYRGSRDSETTFHFNLQAQQPEEQSLGSCNSTDIDLRHAGFSLTSRSPHRFKAHRAKLNIYQL